MPPSAAEQSCAENPQRSAEAGNRIADRCILGLVIAFTLFCAVQGIRLWGVPNAAAARIRCGEQLQRIEEACRSYAKEHRYIFPDEKEWQSAVKPYLRDAAALSGPCTGQYLYRGTGLTLDDNTPLIVCPTHKLAVFPFGELQDYLPKGDEK